MPQTVFDQGDLISSRLKLGVTPDGSTLATFVVYRPDGSTIGGLNASGWTNGDEKTVQFYATDDGTSTGTTVHAAGDWLVVWTVTGTGASVSPKVYNVRRLPSASDHRPAWTPFLSEVADYIPSLTVDTTTPGDQVWLGTFTGTTDPTDEQAMRIVDRAVTLTAIGTAGVSDMPPQLYGAAGAVAAMRAAAIIARTYNRSNDINVNRLAEALEHRADAAYAALVVAVQEVGGGPGGGPAPVGFFPAPLAWGDSNV